MNSPQFLHRVIGVMLVLMFLAGCGAPTATSTLAPGQPAQPTVQPGQPAGQAGTCSQNDISTLGILRSTDHGATWTFPGSACIHGMTNMLPADPTPLVADGRIVLYFVDLAHLEQPVPQTIYRVTSVDGVNFDTPQPVYTQAQTMVDPFVLRMADGTLRLYVPSGPDGIISASSTDGVNFRREETVFSGSGGGMPAALLLPDNRVRLFIDGGPDSPGLASLISDDGINFTAESGFRIVKPPDYLNLNNPEPIRVMDGSYLMLYQTQDRVHEGRPEWYSEIHLATSANGYDWITDLRIIGYGGTSCVVEAPDGTLYIYYGARQLPGSSSAAEPSLGRRAQCMQNLPIDSSSFWEYDNR